MNMLNSTDTNVIDAFTAAPMLTVTKITHVRLRITACPAIMLANRRIISANGFVKIPTSSIAGIIGTGKIAKKLICILRGFGMNILAYDLYPDYNFAREHQVVYTSLDELYHNSDIISLHCPLTEQTKYLINDYSISKMKDGVMIINTGRGQLIHTNALIEGLKNKKIGSAGLDVYEEESEYFYEDQSDKIIDDDTLARLLSFNNVIVTSHQAFFTREALANIASTTLQNIKDFMNHKPLENEVKA